ncbi:hypothetical protein BCR32DRAFT_275137 [Anaeromyces robustus]|uniref:Periplasmic binding protein-like II n=1 Tax=Anaeromyces robustus TaxID=1754192 RepID=A0A1Y1XM33_9FUNG|nr:hypothetical protein BCR32DRAFT_275137 [Anaeromyces robustus]|eukprot:ORX86781.1 hypothetical protein BCR32DRAFT_275137 [Anaeromyces robustus]
MINQYIFTLFIFYVNGIEINAVAFFRIGNNQIYTPFVDDFNEYATKNNLNITVKLNIFSNLNSTVSVNDYGSMLESLLKKKSEKYDVFFYNNMFVPYLGNHFLNLEELLPKEHIDMYDLQILNEFCYNENKLVGLPITVFFTVLYYNSNLINKYNQTIPTTWDELINVSKYILAEEKPNNSELIAYNGLFDDSDYGTCSIYQFLYSFRNDVKSPMPQLTSQEAIDALEMMRKIKNEISSGILFILLFINYHNNNNNNNNNDDDDDDDDNNNNNFSSIF